MKIILLGNAGAGKSTMARQLIGDRNVPRLSLDEIAWEAASAVRRPLADSLADLQRFIAANPQWIIEGCYSDLVEAALPFYTELRFLNPGVEVCVAHCRARPWEPEKFASAEDQQAMLERLIDWVREYPTRDDEYGYRRHRALFDAFDGWKQEYRDVVDYETGTGIET